MRILFLSGEHPDVSGHAGGIGSFVATAAAALAAAGHETHILVCAPGLQRRDQTSHGVHLHERGLLRVLGPVRGSAPRLAAISASARWHSRRLGRFDVVEAPEWLALPAAFTVLRSAPLVVCLQTPSPVVAAHDGRGRPPSRAALHLERWAARRADALLSLSQLLVDELRGSAWIDPGTAVEVAPPAVDHVAWSATPGAEGTEPMVLGIGRLEPRKGFDVLIEALAELADVDGLRLELVGADTDLGSGTGYGNGLQALAARRGVDLQIHGRVTRQELLPLLARARLVAVPSTFDSFNMAGLEALAAGRAVVATDRVGLTELSDGSGAITTVPVGAVKPMAAAIAALVRDASEAGRAGVAGRALAARHSAAAFAAQRERCYRQVAGGRSAG